MAGDKDKDKKYKHPMGDKKLSSKTVAELRVQNPDIFDEFTTPLAHPDLEGFLLPNDGADATPVKIEILHGHIHTPDGLPHGPGEELIVPKYIADPWITEKRVKQKN